MSRPAEDPLDTTSVRDCDPQIFSGVAAADHDQRDPSSRTHATPAAAALDGHAPQPRRSDRDPGAPAPAFSPLLHAEQGATRPPRALSEVVRDARAGTPAETQASHASGQPSTPKQLCAPGQKPGASPHLSPRDRSEHPRLLDLLLRAAVSSNRRQGPAPPGGPLGEEPVGPPRRRRAGEAEEVGVGVRQSPSHQLALASAHRHGPPPGALEVAGHGKPSRRDERPVGAWAAQQHSFDRDLGVPQRVVVRGHGARQSRGRGRKQCGDCACGGDRTEEPTHRSRVGTISALRKD